MNIVSLEDLLEGSCPRRSSPRAPAEALKAQAVTARGEVLAKVGTQAPRRPLPALLRAALRGVPGPQRRDAGTTAAVEATRGEALFSTEGRLVDSVYSAVCGGHTEDNDAVWGGVAGPEPARPARRARAGARLPDPRRAPEKFLAFDIPAACRRSSFAQPTKYRWEKRFTAQDSGRAGRAAEASGRVRHLQPLERGASGRARLLLVSGTRGATELRGELNIRRLFGMLNSAMLRRDAEERDGRGNRRGFVFAGGGWGHGVGMCQTGAIGRAESGQDYREILRHYFNGAEVVRIYE